MPTFSLPKIGSILDYMTYHYDEVPSTNDVAKELAKRAREQKAIIIADTQTSARGRHGRHWISPTGGVWLSFLLRPQITPEKITRLTFIAATAAARTIQDTLDLAAEVKWPNDVLVNRKKLCGILTEATTRNNTVEYVVVGIGINANMGLQAFPDSLQESVTTLEHELSYETDCEALTRDLTQRFDQRYKRLQKGMWPTLLQEWRSLARFLGETVMVTSYAETLVGKALDLDTEGALMIRLQNGTLKKVVTGDVALVAISPSG